MPQTRTRPPQLLIASHNHGAGSELLQLAERRGYAVRRAHSGAQALEQAHAAPPDLVVLDESLTDMAAFAAPRAQELTLQAFHHAQPLACVALAPVTTDGQNGAAVDLLAEVLRGTARRSDAIGRVGPGEFAVIAPGTDRAGAVLLAERLARGVKTLAGATPGLRAGYDAVGNARYTPIEPKNLLSRATTALRAAKGQGGPNWIQGYAG